MLKYYIRFKTKNGDHISAQTMTQEEYVDLLEDTVYMLINNITTGHRYPSVYFEVEQRELCFQPFADKQPYAAK